MKILMVLESNFPPDLRVENEIKSLLAAGNYVSMVCVSDRKHSYTEDWNGCKLYKIPMGILTHKSSVAALKFPFYLNFWRKQLLPILETEKPDAIHIHDLPLARIGIKYRKQFGIRCILDLHENWPALLRMSKHTNTRMGKLLSSNKQWVEYEKNSCLEVDQVIVVIEEASERLKKMGIPENKINLVPNYPVLSDFENIPELPHAEEKKVFLYAGGLTQHRGLQYVIEAIPAILKKAPSFQLVVLGEGNYKSDLQRMAINLNISNHVLFSGKVPYQRVLEELSRSDVALIPHIKSDHTDHTIPHKLFQYMYFGKPVLASNCKPIERIINHSGAGKTYTWNSPTEFAEKAIEMIYNKTNYSLMASRGKEFVEEFYHWGKSEETLVALYKALYLI
jgi:glycosyltransferase involved in cell wall biosynthesis